MTDNEIVKALECCANNPNDCICTESKCPLFGQKCIDILSKDALDLINRQKAEIERLKSGCKKLVEKQNLYKENIQATREYQIEQAKAEAIKEFAERLKKEAFFDTGWCVMPVDCIDNLVKEMVGDV
ncbi:MAG: hypothetical protein IJ043_03155 [Clostridia bacterium]|nr:hypothetical protein [Clostridia bacterium]